MVDTHHLLGTTGRAPVLSPVVFMEIPPLANLILWPHVTIIPLENTPLALVMLIPQAVQAPAKVDTQLLMMLISDSPLPLTVFQAMPLQSKQKS